jgi:hypothetical protein
MPRLTVVLPALFCGAEIINLDRFDSSKKNPFCSKQSVKYPASQKVFVNRKNSTSLHIQIMEYNIPKKLTKI